VGTAAQLAKRKKLDIYLDTDQIGVCHGGYRTKESVAKLSEAVDQARHGAI
jgi:hypothetical protein